MSWLTDLRDMAAATAQDILAAIPGETVSYSQKSGTAITGLEAFPGPVEIVGDSVQGISIESKRRTFFIPKQTGSSAFPPTNGPNLEDTISYDSVTWIVIRYELDPTGAGYLIDTEASQANKLGVE